MSLNLFIDISFKDIISTFKDNLKEINEEYKDSNFHVNVKFRNGEMESFDLSKIQSIIFHEDGFACYSANTLSVSFFSYKEIIFLELVEVKE